jgi:hypothetical protein
MKLRRFSQYPAFLSRTAKERDKKYIGVAVQNVKPLYFLSRSFEIREKGCQ